MNSHSTETERRRRRSRLLRRVAGATLVLLLIAAVAWLSHAVVLHNGLQAMHGAALQRLEVEATRLDGELERFDYLPSLLETSPDVMRLLDEAADPDLRESVSRYLKSLNSIAGAQSLYVLDRTGLAVAASDAGQPGSPFGHDFSYRPYMRDALANGRGRFYGVGVTSGRAGYYLSYALPALGPAQGVATVKVDLEAGQKAWRDLPGEMLLLDEHQVVILASRPDWKYHPLGSLSPEVRAEAVQARRYGNADLQPLDWRVRERFAAQASRVRADGRSWLVSERAVNDGRWRLLLLDAEAPARLAAAGAAASAALAAAVLLLLGLLMLQRQRALRQRLASREALQAAHDTLELKVQERTAELHAAQDQLVHAGKLAVLGQLSAGMVHEFNQPLAALRTLSDNATQLIERDRLDEAQANLSRIGRVVDRLGRLTGQLKVFAHKSNQPAAPVGVRKVINETLALLAERILESGIEVALAVEPADLAVMAEEARLEQVFGNLIGNAIDALAGVEGGQIEIEAEARGARCVITVRNSGPNIAAEVLPHLFEPFVTSKPAGKGLGLGLMISAHIVRAFGGSLAARNLAPTGAEFTIELPCHPRIAPPA